MKNTSWRKLKSMLNHIAQFDISRAYWIIARELSLLTLTQFIDFRFCLHKTTTNMKKKTKIRISSSVLSAELESNRWRKWIFILVRRTNYTVDFFYIYKQHDTHNYYSKSRVRSLVSRLIQIMRYKPMCRTTLCLCIATAIKGLIKRGDREIAHDRMRIAELIHPRRLIRLSSMDQQRKKCVVIMQIVWRSGSGTLKLNRVLENVDTKCGSRLECGKVSLLFKDTSESIWSMTSPMRWPFWLV